MIIDDFAGKPVWAFLIDIAPLVDAIANIPTIIPIYASLIVRRKCFQFPSVAVTSITTFYKWLLNSFWMRDIDTSA